MWRFVGHFDVDAFYASVAVRDDPSLRGKPVAIAHSGRRSVVLTASYEARPFGVRSAIPLWKALEACPDLIVVAPDLNKYKTVSREIFACFGARGHAVEGLSLDEAFVDLGECTLEEAQAFAAQMRADVLAATGLTVSAGVGSGKMIAKIASDLCKPNGILAIQPGNEISFLAPLPVGRLWGIGPKTQARLSERGVTTIGDVAALDVARLHEYFGSSGLQVGQLARGIDGRRVESDRETKSISSEETFEYDVRDQATLIAMLKEQARDVAAKLEREGLCASTVGIKIKRGDHSAVVRQTSLAEPTREVRRIYKAAVYCLRRAALGDTPVRLLGTRVASLSKGDSLQQSLFVPAPAVGDGWKRP